MLGSFSFIIALVIGLISIGVTGYMLIEHWNFIDALYMTIITLSTVGYTEIYPLSQNGRIFTILFISFGIIVLAIIISRITSLILEGEIGTVMRRRKMEKNISKLKKHYIVCGLGDVGQTTLFELHKMKVSSVGIDKNPEVIKKILEENPNLLLIEGDATDDSVLLKAGIKDARGILSALPEDAENLFIIISGKNLNPEIKIISKANDERALLKLKKSGADYIISPKQIAGLRMASVAARPDVVSFLDVMMRDVEESWRVEQAGIPEKSPFQGKTLREAAIPSKTGLLVIAMRKRNGEYIYNPPATTIMEKGDVLLVLGNFERLERLRKYLETGR